MKLSIWKSGTAFLTAAASTSSLLSVSAFHSTPAFFHHTGSSTIKRPLTTKKKFLISVTTTVRGGSSTNTNNQRQQSGTQINAATMSTTAATASSSTTPKYDELMTELDMITQLARASSVLEYDKMVFMPHTDAASKERGKQSAALASVRHEKSTSEQLGKLIRQAEEELASSSKQDKESSKKSRNVELARIDYEKKSLIPKELQAKEAALQAEAYTSWAKAREADDYTQFQDSLDKCIALSKEIAECKRPIYPSDAKLYEIMMDQFEMGMSSSRVDLIFREIKSALVPLIDRVLRSDQATPPSTAPLEGHFDIDAQKAVCNQLVKSIGYDDTNGRIDVSVHPFTMSLNPKDVRITSRFRPDEWYQGLAGTIHEGGHAIYEQNLPCNSEPIDEALSMGMHESQSLFWERHVGLSKPFWTYAAPIVNAKFGVTYTPEDYYGAVNAAKQTNYIRVEADELTYPLHVILRYEIERDFVEGKLSAPDIPQRWNKEFEQLLGLAVPSDAKGCLQDIHWSMMAYGYFPTYLIGSATAAQLAHYCRKDIPDMDDKIAEGEFQEIKAWLTDKIHRHGKSYKSLDEHLSAELGEPLNPKYFIDYLTNKYTELYKV